MNYEAIILELGNKIAQLSIDNAVLLTRVQEEIKNKEAVEEKYMEAINTINNYRFEKTINDVKETTCDEQE